MKKVRDSLVKHVDGVDSLGAEVARRGQRGHRLLPLLVPPPALRLLPILYMGPGQGRGRTSSRRRDDAAFFTDRVGYWFEHGTGECIIITGDVGDGIAASSSTTGGSDAYMGQITKLTRQKGRRGRVNVFIEDEFAFGLSEEEVSRAGLHSGMTLEQADIDALRARDEAVSYLNDALRYLSFRPRSLVEVERYMRGRGADDSATSATLEKLTRAGFVDDAAFTRFWIENRDAFSPRGTRALQAELRAKGVDRAQVDAVLAETDGDDGARAYGAGLKRMRLLSRADKDEFRRRMYGFLQRRGFSYETARAAAERLWNESPAGQEAASSDDEWESAENEFGGDDV